MTHDELHTKAVDALRILGTTTDDDKREAFLKYLLVTVYQDGQLDMQSEIIAKNDRTLAEVGRRSDPLEGLNNLERDEILRMRARRLPLTGRA